MQRPPRRALFFNLAQGFRHAMGVFDATFFPVGIARKTHDFRESLPHALPLTEAGSNSSMNGCFSEKLGPVFTPNRRGQRQSCLIRALRGHDAHFLEVRQPLQILKLAATITIIAKLARTRPNVWISLPPCGPIAAYACSTRAHVFALLVDVYRQL